MIYRLLIFLFLVSIANCGIPGRPLPPIDKESIGHGFPKKDPAVEQEAEAESDIETEKKKKDLDATGNP